MSPVKIRKVRGRKCYSVKDTKHTHAKCTSLYKAKAQKRILEQSKRK